MDMVKRLIKSGIVIMVLGFLVFRSCSFSARTSQKLLEKADGNYYDAIVVPGVPFEGDKWSATMKARVYWSIYLYRKGIAKHIIYTGGAVHSPYVEAEIMAMYAVQLGVSKEHILKETKAEHSTENIYYSYQMAQELGFQKVALASDPFQTKLLKKFVWKRVSPEIDLIPIVIDSLREFEKTLVEPSIDYQNAKVENFVPLKERENFWERMRGTRGKNIDY